MKIEIKDKYTYIYDELEEQVQYFENFECKEEKNKKIRIHIESSEGEEFLKENNGKILNASVSWFGESLDVQVRFTYKHDDVFSLLELLDKK